MLRLFYTKASDNYILVNKETKDYVIVSVKYKTLSEIEKVLQLRVAKVFPCMKTFKKEYKALCN